MHNADKAIKVIAILAMVGLVVMWSIYNFGTR
jgi:hypothetical protein